jgi:hypothetical protein
LTGKLMHDVQRLYHQPLRAGDLSREVLGVGGGLLFQCRQMEIDSRQHLGDFIMKVAADPPSFFLLSR